MLPIENGTKAIHTTDSDDAADKSSKASDDLIGADVRDGGNCGNVIRVKVVAEINENCGAPDVLVELNNTQNTRKRLASTEEASSSKRNKLTECSADELPVSTSAESAKEVGVRHVEEADDGVDNHNVSGANECDAPPADNEESAEESDNIATAATVRTIKREPPTEPSGDDTNEVQPSGSGTSNPVDIKPAVKVEKADASSTSRETCKFGIRCYRRNPMHRIEEAHPGDHDYKRPSYPPPPDGTPDCPFGDKCYRRNPVHFQQYYHPPDTDFEQNYRNYRMHLRQRPPRPNDDRNNASGNSSDLDDDYDLDDPFIDDGALDSDYMPSDNGDDEGDYDECDRAEE